MSQVTPEPGGVPPVPPRPQQPLADPIMEALRTTVRPQLQHGFPAEAKTQQPQYQQYPQQPARQPAYAAPQQNYGFAPPVLAKLAILSSKQTATQAVWACSNALELGNLDDARAHAGAQAEGVRVALPGQHTRRTRAFAGPQDRPLRAVFIDHDDGMRAPRRLAPPHDLQWKRGQIETGDRHLYICSGLDIRCQYKGSDTIPRFSNPERSLLRVPPGRVRAGSSGSLDHAACP